MHAAIGVALAVALTQLPRAQADALGQRVHDFDAGAGRGVRLIDQPEARPALRSVALRRAAL